MDKTSKIIKQFSPYKGIIVDFDGTMVDLFVNWHDLKKELSNEYHLRQGLSLENLLTQIKINHGLLALQKAFLTVEKYELMFPEKCISHVDLLEKIKIWHKNGMRLSIFSNNMLKTIDYFLEKEKLTSVFDPIISKERVARPKPDPEGLQIILSSWKLNLEKVLFIGNSSYDQIVGDACGVKTVII